MTDPLRTRSRSRTWSDCPDVVLGPHYSPTTPGFVFKSYFEPDILISCDWGKSVIKSSCNQHRNNKLLQLYFHSELESHRIVCLVIRAEWEQNKALYTLWDISTCQRELWFYNKVIQTYTCMCLEDIKGNYENAPALTPLPLPVTSSNHALERKLTLCRGYENSKSHVGHSVLHC